MRSRLGVSQKVDANMSALQGGFQRGKLGGILANDDKGQHCGSLIG